MVVKAFMDRKENEQKQSRVEVYNTAYLTSMFVGLILGGKVLPTYEDIYKEGIQVEQEGPTRAEIEASIMQDKLQEFAKKANENRKK